jgi:hypothetical protein
MLIIVFTHVVFGFFQSLRSSVIGGFDPMCVSLRSWVFGYFGGGPNRLWVIPVVGIKWRKLGDLGNRIVVGEFCLW